MQIGVFSKTFEGDLETVFRKMNALNIYHTQFNPATAGMEALPEQMDESILRKVKAAADKYKITLDALSGTFNMIDPDLRSREEGTRRFKVMCEIAAYLEIPIVTLCTGSRNLQSKWKWDDKNLSTGAWNDLIETTERILSFAEEYNIILGVETEASNIINTPPRARKYLDCFKSEHLKIIMDGANLYLPSELRDTDAVLKEAFEILGRDIVLAHAKDISFGEELKFAAAGEGGLNFEMYIHLLKGCGYQGAVIMHGLTEEQVPHSLEYLKGKLGDA